MPIDTEQFCDDRVDFTRSLSRKEIQSILYNKQIKTVQTTKPVEKETWILLNELLFSQRPDMELRVYGFFSQICDLAFLSLMTNVTHFSADCLTDAINFEAISELKNLKTLSFGVFHAESFAFLSTLNPTLKQLLLGPTKSKKPSLKPLENFKDLGSLYIDGQSKDISVLANLENLEHVTLRSVTTPDLSYLTTLKKLCSLEIKLGGIKDLNSICGMENIKFLELWQIRNLENIEVISHLPGLQKLFLQSLLHITKIPSLKNAVKLRKIVVENLKGLADFSELEWAPALEEFLLISGQCQSPEDLRPLLANKNLKNISAGFGTDKKNQLFLKMLEGTNLKEYRHSEFVYQ